jgi:polyribonucleotide nucleotidyltransferase
LTDISGLEDHLGDMDFKVVEQQTALPLTNDIKVAGVNADILVKALEQAKRGRLKLLDIMNETLSAPRPKLSQYAPRITSTKVPQLKIGEIIGPGGKMIRQIQEDFECEIDIQEDGSVTVTGKDQAKVDGAIAFIDSMVAEVEVGKTYEGTVVRIEAFGAFVNVIPGKDGLVHVSQVSPEAFRSMKMGDKVSVRCYENSMVESISPCYKKVKPPSAPSDLPVDPVSVADSPGVVALVVAVIEVVVEAEIVEVDRGRPSFSKFRDTR